MQNTHISRNTEKKNEPCWLCTAESYSLPHSPKVRTERPQEQILLQMHRTILDYWMHRAVGAPGVAMAVCPCVTATRYSAPRAGLTARHRHLGSVWRQS